MGKDTACHQESGRNDGTAASPSESPAAIPLLWGLFCPPFQILLLGTEWEHRKREPNSLPEAAETCLQLPSYLHFSNGLILKSFYLTHRLQVGNKKKSWREIKSPPKP